MIAWQCYSSAIINNLFNPKALLFFMVFLPQFVSSNIDSPPREQLIVLGLILNFMGLLFNVFLVFILSGIVDSKMKNNDFRRRQQKLIGAVFALLGVWMLAGLAIR